MAKQDNVIIEVNKDKIEYMEDLLPFGNPGPVADLLVRGAYVGCYDRRERNPHWVLEHLVKNTTNHGKVDRAHLHFKQDSDIPSQFQSRLQDYTGSGYDRGHLVPAADVSDNPKDLKESFLLTNVSPQVAIGFNRGFWAQFERFVRNLTSTFDHVYVYTGCLYRVNTIEDGKHYVKYEKIGDPPNTSVPTHFFKVILGIQNDQYYLGSFIVPNEPIYGRNLSEFVVPVNVIQNEAGLEFFPKLNYPTKPLCSTVRCQDCFSKPLPLSNNKV